MLTPDPTPHAGLLADAGSLLYALLVIVLTFSPYLDALERLTIGALAIILLALRIRSHRRRDAAERRDGTQA